MATNRLPGASRKRHDSSTIILEIGVLPQTACGSTLTFTLKMNLRCIAIFCLFGFIGISCDRAESSAPENDLGDTIPTTDQELVETARKFLFSQQSWNDPVKTDPVTRDSRPVALFAPPPPTPDEEHTFRTVLSGSDFVVLIHRYGTHWKAWAVVLDGETETVTFDGRSLQDCLELVRETFPVERPFERI